MNIRKDTKSVKQPLDWLGVLSRAILSTRCRIHSKDCSFEKGLAKAGDILNNAILSETSVWWAGNGGSAAICSHLSQDVLNKLGIKSLYTGDASLMTCMANDFGYDKVYAKPLESFVKKNDILIAISSSGNSENILSCVELANEVGLHVISLSGMNDNNKLFNCVSDVSFFVQSDLYGIVETGHEAILHGIIETLWLNIQDPKAAGPKIMKG
ncbi:MAG: SIS domain-containing protein [Deltaproteobacteria bacterium]|nr:SIS domain-containing protein [Deltaproteobacteria bacterium]